MFMLSVVENSRCLKKKKSSDCDHDRNPTTGITFKAPRPISSPSLWLSFLFIDPIPWPNELLAVRSISIHPFFFFKPLCSCG